MTNDLALTRQDRLMVLAVHPDDETLGAGGLLQQAAAIGAAVRVIFITNGDNNPWPQRLLERRWRFDADDRLRWGQRRQQEALAALAMLGIGGQHAVFLGLPDQGLTALLNGDHEKVSARLGEEIAGWQPSLLIVPSLQDTHPDHNAVAVLTALALSRFPLAMRPRVLSYLIHGREMFNAAACGISLTAQQLDTKRQAILCYCTQMAFGRRRFLNYAQMRERFLHTPAAGVFQPWHPVLEAAVSAQQLHIHVRMGRLLRRFGKPKLYMLAPHAQRRIKLNIALAGAEAEIRDSASGGSLGRAVVDRADGVVKVAMPVSMFEGVDNLYLKLERRWGFFDLAGWRPVALQAAPRQIADVVGIIPCYNVDDFCEQVIRQTVHFVDQLIVIDDGSTDNTPDVLAKLAAAMPERISVITFAHNQGKGVGLMAGFCAALNRFEFRTLVTLDGDGQHPPAEIPHLVATIATGAEMAIGGRELTRMPARSKLGNTVVSSLLRWLYAHAPADTQSGLRAFNREFAEEIVRMVKGSRYETEIQVLLLALSQRRNFATISIPTIYIDNNRSSKFRPVTDSIRILYALLGWELNHGHRFKP